MQITYELTEKDFVEAFRIHRNRTAFSRWVRRISTAVFALGMGVILVVFLIEPGDRRATTLLTLCALGAFWIAAVWFLPRWSARRQFRKQPSAHGPRTVSLDAYGSHSRWNGGSSDIAWKNYVRWIEGQNHILVYFSPYRFGVIPTRALQPAQLAELREMLKQNIQTGK